MQVYLPDALYRAVKERDLPASELLQEAVEAEIERGGKEAVGRQIAVTDETADIEAAPVMSRGSHDVGSMRCSGEKDRKHKADDCSSQGYSPLAERDRALAVARLP